MLKQDSGVYACIAEDVVRYNLGEVGGALFWGLGVGAVFGGLEARGFLGVGARPKG
jgi:hypothetical protein